MEHTRPLRIGTRQSPLAMIQTRLVMAALQKRGIMGQCVPLSTPGDAVQDRPLAEIGGKGLFTRTLDRALLEGEIDCAVHSMKDVPTHLEDGLILPAMLVREDVRDVLITLDGRGLDDLRAGDVVGSTSLRRMAQLQARIHGLKTTLFRGNIQTRLKKIHHAEATATVLAAAGLKRAGLFKEIIAGAGQVTGCVIECADMLPAAGQGAIGITCRADDARMIERLTPVNHVATDLCVSAERALLERLDGSCRTPIAAYGCLEGDTLLLRALVAQPDGSRLWHDERRIVVGARDTVLDDARRMGTALRTEVGEDFFHALKDIF